MARAIQDSDDEGDYIVVGAADAAAVAEAGSAQEEELPANVPDEQRVASKPHSTGSTDQLRNQILDAERDLAQTSMPTVKSGEVTLNALPISTSPSLLQTKRRHTMVADCSPEKAPAKKLKRTKTQKNYSTQVRSTSTSLDFVDELQHTGYNISVVGSDAAAVRVSSDDFTAATFEADVQKHALNARFRHSGSTVADDPSAQQRLFEHAIGARKQPSVPTPQRTVLDETKSSSLQLSISHTQTAHIEPTDSTKIEVVSDGENTSYACNRGKTIAPGTSNDVSLRAPESYLVAKVLEALGKTSEQAGTLCSDDSKIERYASMTDKPAISLINANPIVRIPPPEEAETSEAPPTAQRAGKLRNRKVEEQQTSEPLDSDEIAIGIPKERYVPRPSKRRTTHVEDPIDYSANPMKMAKLKRAKTSAEATATQINDSPKRISISVKKRETSKLDAGNEASPNIPENRSMFQDVNNRAGRPEVESPAKPESHTAPRKTPMTTEIDSAKQHSSLGLDNDVGMKPTAHSSQLSNRSSQISADQQIFVKPAPKTKPKANAKRCHTTIFEDHVEFIGSERSLSLRQQQARRKADVKDDPLPRPKQRKRRAIPQLDDSEEDELGLDVLEVPVASAEPAEELPVASAERVEELPKKRGRGRPPKCTAKPAPGSPDKILDDSENGVVSEDEDESEDAVPTKRVRGSSAKQAPSKDAGSTFKVNGQQGAQPGANAAAADNETQNFKMPASDLSAIDGGEVAVRDDTIKLKNDGEEVGRQQSPAPKSTLPAKDTASKPDPVSHSHIKSSPKVPLRVGLSKRQKIQPLLRILNR